MDLKQDKWKLTMKTLLLMRIIAYGGILPNQQGAKEVARDSPYEVIFAGRIKSLVPYRLTGRFVQDKLVLATT